MDRAGFYPIIVSVKPLQQFALFSEDQKTSLRVYMSRQRQRQIGLVSESKRRAEDGACLVAANLKSGRHLNLTFDILVPEGLLLLVCVRDGSLGTRRACHAAEQRLKH